MVNIASVVFVLACCCGAAPPTLELNFDQPQQVTVAGQTVAIEGQFDGGYWTYGKKALTIPAQGLLGEQGTIIYRFKVSPIVEEPMKARYLMILRDARRFYFGPYMLTDGKKLFVAVCDDDKGIKDYYTISEDIQKDEPYTFAAAWDGEDLRLYLNGVLVEQVEQKFAFPAEIRSINLGPYVDGWTNPPVWGDDCHAGMIVTFDQALGSEQIAALSGAVVKPITDVYSPSLTVGAIGGDAPVIDGDLSDKAWQAAGGAIRYIDAPNGPASWATPPSSFAITYDQSNLYLGLKTLFPGRVPIKAGGLRDENEADVWGTESFEFYLQTGDALYRFGGNVAGGYVEGKGLDTSYSGPWTYRSSMKMRIDDRQLWQGEAAIPWSSLGLTGPPTELIRFNVCRSWFLPDTSTYGSLTPDGQYQTVEAYPILTFAPSTAALTVVDQNDPSGGRFTQHVRISGTADGQARYEVLLARHDTGAEPFPLYTGDVTYKAGVPADLKFDVPVTRSEYDRLIFTLTQSGKVVLCQVIPFKLNEDYVAVKPSFMKTTVRLLTKTSQLHGKFGADFKGVLRVTGPNGEAIARVDASPTGENVIDFPRANPAGDYTVELVNAADDSLVDARTFSYPGVGEWESLTFDDRIIAPFTPLEVAVGPGSLDASAWGRTYRWHNSILPTQIVTQGEELFAAPATIEIGGVPLAPAKFVNGSSAPHRTEFTARAGTDAYEITETAWMEYDGVQHSAFTLTAHENLGSVKLKVTLPAERVKFLHTSYDYNWGVRRTEAVGKGYAQTLQFYPSVWIGDYEKGLCLFAESNATWKSDTNAAITLTNDGITAVYTAVLANELKAGETLTFDFGFLASPVKPLPSNYPLNTFSDQFSAKMNRLGKTPTADVTLSDYGYGPLGGFFCDIPTPEQSENAPQIKHWIDAAHEHGGRGAPYFMARFLSDEYPEVIAFKDSWRITPALSIDYVRQGKKYGLTEICPFSSGANFYMWKTKQYLQRIPSDGIYFDFGIPPFCNNAEHGCHNRSTMLGQREFYRRVMLCLIDSGVEEPAIIAHNTDSVMLPAFTFVTHLFNGEQIRQHSSTLMHDGKDILDTYDATRFATELASLPFGINNSIYHAQDLLLPEFGGTNEDPDLYKFRLTKAVIAGGIVHGTLPSISRLHFGIFDKIVRIYDRFGVPRSRFIGYWKQPATVSAGKDIFVSVYRHPSGEKALAVISHIGREHINQDVVIAFNSDVLDMGPFNRATEMLTAPDSEYDELIPMLESINDVNNNQGQVLRTPIVLGDFGCSVTSIDDNVLKMKLNYHSFAIVELR
jgi:hypothetical protein